MFWNFLVFSPSLLRFSLLIFILFEFLIRFRNEKFLGKSWNRESILKLNYSTKLYNEKEYMSEIIFVITLFIGIFCLLFCWPRNFNILFVKSMKYQLLLSNVRRTVITLQYSVMDLVIIFEIRSICLSKLLLGVPNPPVCKISSYLLRIVKLLNDWNGFEFSLNYVTHRKDIIVYYTPRREKRLYQRVWVFSARRNHR